MTIACIDPRTDPLWCRLLERYTSTGSLFHAPRWMQALTNTYGFEVRAYVALNLEGEPVAGLPFVRVEDPLGKRIVSLPFSDYCDPLVDNAHVWEQLSAKLLAEACPVTLRCLHNTLPLNDPRFTLTKRAKWHGVDLRAELTTLQDDLHSSAKRAIRKAQRGGVTVSAIASREALRTFFDLHLQTRKYKYRLLAQPYGFFEALRSAFLNEQHGVLMLAVHGGHVIGGTMFIGWGDTLFYKFNASDRHHLAHRPNDLLIWSGIEYAKANGYTYLDFGLSDWEQEGLIRYKRKFATEEKTIAFLHHSPNTSPSESEKSEDAPKSTEQVRQLLPQLTELFTDPSVPDEVTEKRG